MPERTLATLTRVLRFPILTCALYAITSCGATGPVAPLTVAGAGVITNDVIDNLDKKARGLIDKATQDGALLSSSVGRDLLLLVQALRQELHDELDTQWDRLDETEVGLLREVDSTLDKANLLIQRTQNIEDTVNLDIEQRLAQLPFGKTVPALRRVDGSTLYYKGDPGSYRVVLEGNIFQSNMQYVIKIKDPQGSNYVPLPPDSIVPAPPYSVAVTLSSAQIGPFNPLTISHIPILVQVTIPNRHWFFQIWKPKTRIAEFTPILELLPRFPITYRLTEYRSAKVVDREHRQRQLGPDHFIPGCGDSGCWTSYDICTVVPPGSELIGPVEPPVVSGPAGYYRWDAYRQTPTGYCRVFWQNSHNQARNVHFDVNYYGLKDDSIICPLGLVELVTEPKQAAATSTSNQDVAPSIQQIVSSAIQFVQNSITTMPYRTFSNPTPASLSCKSQQSGSNANVLEYGKTYDAHFSTDMVGFELMLHQFTGDEAVVTEAANPPKGYSVSPVTNTTGFKRMTIRPDLPWQ